VNCSALLLEKRGIIDCAESGFVIIAGLVFSRARIFVVSVTLKLSRMVGQWCQVVDPVTGSKE